MYMSTLMLSDEYTVLIGVSHHVVAGNLKSEPLLVLVGPTHSWLKDLFKVMSKYTIAVFRHTRKGC